MRVATDGFAGTGGVPMFPAFSVQAFPGSIKGDVKKKASPRAFQGEEFLTSSP